jgi:hypothetical protein
MKERCSDICVKVCVMLTLYIGVNTLTRTHGKHNTVLTHLTQIG